MKKIVTMFDNFAENKKNYHEIRYPYWNKMILAWSYSSLHLWFFKILFLNIFYFLTIQFFVFRFLTSSFMDFRIFHLWFFRFLFLNRNGILLLGLGVSESQRKWEMMKCLMIRLRNEFDKKFFRKSMKFESKWMILVRRSKVFEIKVVDLRHYIFPVFWVKRNHFLNIVSIFFIQKSCWTTNAIEIHEHFQLVRNLTSKLINLVVNFFRCWKLFWLWVF